MMAHLWMLFSVLLLLAFPFFVLFYFFALIHYIHSFLSSHPILPSLSHTLSPSYSIASLLWLLNPPATMGVAASVAATPFSQTVTRTSPAIVVWLQEHFVAADGVSLGRSTLYQVSLGDARAMRLSLSLPLCPYLCLGFCVSISISMSPLSLYLSLCVSFSFFVCVDGLKKMQSEGKNCCLYPCILLINPPSFYHSLSYHFRAFFSLSSLSLPSTTATTVRRTATSP